MIVEMTKISESLFAMPMGKQLTRNNKVRGVVTTSSLTPT